MMFEYLYAKYCKEISNPKELARRIYNEQNKKVLEAIDLSIQMYKWGQKRQMNFFDHFESKIVALNLLKKDLCLEKKE